MPKKNIAILILFFTFFAPSYSQNVFNISLSTQEMQNGIELFNQRKYTVAIQAFELALAYEPLNHAAKYRLGLAYLYAGYVQNATRTWEELVRLGVADYQVIEKLNNLYFRMSIDENYDYEDPYIFREYYDGFTQGGHSIFRSSFITYDPVRDLKYVSSTGKKQVVVLDNGNNIIASHGARFFLPNYLEMPMGTAIYNGFLYVADYKKNEIFVFNRDEFGTLSTRFGETGAGANQLSGPMGITISDDQYLYIVDNGNNRIQKFLPDGTHIYNFGSQYLYRPTDIKIKDGIIYVTDIDKTRQGRLVLFDTGGNFITNIGEDFLKEPRGLFLEENKLHISDSSGYVYIYDTLTKKTSTFLDGSKLVSPFDIVKGKDKILWRTDMNSEKLAIYTPLQGIYGNIDLDITQILTDQYPYVYALIRARTKDNDPVTRITKEELTLTEFDQPVKNLLITETPRDKMKLSIIVDRSIASQPYTPQLEYYLKSFLSNTTGDDIIDIVLVDDDKTIRSGEQVASVSRAWNFITNYQPVSPVPQVWDIPIYDSITKLLNNLRNRAIIIFTSGESYQGAFSEYSIDIIKTYADQNNIPIYVVNFGGKNVSTWSQMAKESHGQYFDANSHADEILHLHTIIKESTPLEYLIEYEALNYSDVPNLWVEMDLHLERFGISGATTGGYYVPTPKRSVINIHEDFFPPATE